MRKPKVATDRPAGFYTELVRLHNWPPKFSPRFDYGAHAMQTMRADNGRLAGLSARQEYAVLLPGTFPGIGNFSRKRA